MKIRILALAVVALFLAAFAASAQTGTWTAVGDLHGEQYFLERLRDLLVRGRHDQLRRQSLLCRGHDLPHRDHREPAALDAAHLLADRRSEDNARPSMEMGRATGVQLFLSSRIS